MRIAVWMESFFKDLRYGLRQFRRNPIFTAVAVLSLGLGIGANTAIFSVMNAVLLKSLPVRDPQQLIMLTDPTASGISIGASRQRSMLTYPEYVQMRDHATTVSALLAAESELDNWDARIDGAAPEQVHAKVVSENYFSLFGVEPAIGRAFAPEDAKGIGTDPYVVISYDYWQRRFAGKASVLGTSIHMAQANLIVIGVAPPGFHGETVGENPDFWIAMMMQPKVYPGRDWLHEDLSQSPVKTMWLHVFGRLKPGVSRAQAQTEFNVLFHAALDASYPAAMAPEARKPLMDQHLTVHDASTGAFGGRDEFSQQLLLLLAASGVVLLIACANVANLLLARAAARYKEVGVRLSIGAARWRLVRQFLTESLLLSLLGGIAGVLIAAAAARALVLVLSSQGSALQLATGLDLRVLAFTAAATLLTGVLFGLAPAIRGTRVDLNHSLRDTGSATTSPSSRLTFAKLLVVVQVGLSLLMTVGAGLFLRTLWNLQSVNLGYAKENLLLINVDPTTAGYQNARLLNFYHEAAQRVQSLPGVRGASYSVLGLFSGGDLGLGVDVEGFTPQKNDERGSRFDVVGPGYFSTLGVPMRLGREITAQDTAASVKVCVINDAFAKKFFANRNPIGLHVTRVFGPNRDLMEVIGVAANAHDQQLRNDVPPRFFVPMDQATADLQGAASFEVRAAGDPQQMLSTIHKTILSINADIPSEEHSLGELIFNVNAAERMIARLCTLFGIVALLLAATGLYGVLSYGVARRTNEIGIRMALGAGRLRVVTMILRETGIMIVIGVVLGLGAAVALTRFIAARLYGLSALDPVTMVAAVFVLGAIALAAAYIPATRAAGVNPVRALRHE